MSLQTLLGERTLTVKLPTSPVLCIELHDAVVRLISTSKHTRAAALLLCAVCPELKIPIRPDEDLAQEAREAADALIGLGYAADQIWNAAFPPDRRIMVALKNAIPVRKNEVQDEKKDS